MRQEPIKRFLTLILLCFISSACDSVTYIERLTIVNPTEYTLLIEVKSKADESWLPLGEAKRNASTTKEGVLDMGEIWVFRFRYVGEELGEQEISRADLENQKWRYTIPKEIGDVPKEKGFRPSLAFVWLGRIER